MLTYNSSYLTKNAALAKQPVYVAEIFFNHGATGADGTNDIYFSTCDVLDLLNFPYPEHYFPVMKSNSIGSLSQQVDPINGVSTIGNLSLVVTDYKGMVSNIIRAADAAGHGFRRQRISIFKLFKGMSWADRVLVRTMQILDLKLSALNEYTITAGDVQKQMQKTLFNPMTTVTTVAVAASGAAVITVNDARPFAPANSVSYGSSGFIQIDQEIMRWTVAAPFQFAIAAIDRGLFGTTAAAHSAGANVTEIVYLNENPITMMLKLLESSGTAGALGAYDAYPAHWGCAMSSSNDVAEADWLQVGQLLTGLSATLPASSDGLQFEFLLNKGVQAKKFIEDSILKILGAFGFVRGDGRYSIRAYNDLANAIKENCSVWLNVNNVIAWGDLTYNYQNLANQLWIDYDEQPRLSGKYIRSALFMDSVSIKKWGDAPQLKYVAQGIPPTSAFVNQLYQRFQRVMARYSRPPMQLQLTLLPSMDMLEIGDIVRVTLPMRDLFTGAPLDRAFEVISTQMTPANGQIVATLIAQPELANFWFQGSGAVASVTISPSQTTLTAGASQQFVARAFDAGGTQVPIPAISWLASGNLTIDQNGLTTAGAVGSGSVSAVVGKVVSNQAAVSIAATASTVAPASVAVLPSQAMLAVGGAQQFVAQAYDVGGNILPGKKFNWTSSNSAIASVSAIPAAATVVTATGNGQATITATESISGLTSPACAVTVAVPATPTFIPPAIADSAYKIGTQITGMGAVGGPHTIPNGYDFAAGDYWFDGNVTLPLGSSCTINGTVRLFSLGVITINGFVDGRGRGVPGASGSAPVSAAGIYPFLLAGAAGSIRGFLGDGGSGGGAVFGKAYVVPALAGAAGIYPSPPVITITGSSVQGSLTSLIGLPAVLLGSQSAGGGSGLTRSDLSHAGGASGAGLLLAARGVYLTIGKVDLSGLAGITPPPTSTYWQFGTGGGGGGSFVVLAERNINGLPVMSVLPTCVLTAGGAGGSNAGVAGTQPTAGGSGAFIAQVIG